ncbi:hypothetical protein [uncultured Enterococcus sp.]|uniref:hypothetical protein n=1 Tax=uncultured Enterococcus sp. TaxID=167972 RepID=UPI00259AC4EB|nr:hypothetical protein [uncultured Enterococcus sp.]
MKKRKQWRKVPKMILVFICSLSLFAIFVLGILKITLFNQNFMIRAVESSHYGETITKEINHTIADVGRGANISQKWLNQTVSESLVNDNIKQYIHSIYAGSTFQLEGEKQIEETVQSQLESYGKEKNYPRNAEFETTVNKLKKVSIETVRRDIEIPYFALYGKKIMAYTSTLNLLLIFAVAFFGILFSAIISLNKPFFHLIIRYLAYVIGGAGLMVGALPTYLYVTRLIERLGIHSEALYLFLTTYLKNFLFMFMKFGLFSILLSLFLFGVSEFFRKKIVRREK